MFDSLSEFSEKPHHIPEMPVSLNHASMSRDAKKQKYGFGVR